MVNEKQAFVVTATSSVDGWNSTTVVKVFFGENAEQRAEHYANCQPDKGYYRYEVVEPTDGVEQVMSLHELISEAQTNEVIRLRQSLLEQQNVMKEAIGLIVTLRNSCTNDEIRQWANRTLDTLKEYRAKVY